MPCYQQSLSRINIVNCHNDRISLGGTIVGSAESFFTFDRLLATVAIVVGVVGIWRAEHLFGKLNKRADKMREDFLGSATTTLVSYASFTKALQGIALSPTELSKDGAFALLTSFYF